MMDSQTIMSLSGLVVSVSTAGVLAYLQWKKNPVEIKSTRADTASTALEATDKALALNKKYIERIDSLETRNDELEHRLDKMEKPQKYHIVVEFETSIPPQVGKVEIIPIDESGTLP
jgi:hypothetical protein